MKNNKWVFFNANSKGDLLLGFKSSSYRFQVNKNKSESKILRMLLFTSLGSLFCDDCKEGVSAEGRSP